MNSKAASKVCPLGMSSPKQKLHFEDSSCKINENMGNMSDNEESAIFDRYFDTLASEIETHVLKALTFQPLSLKRVDLILRLLFGDLTLPNR
jgi:hypothetical protein